MDLKTLFRDTNMTSLWRFSIIFHGLSCLLFKGFVKLPPNFWFQLMVGERDNLFLFSKATLQITPFGLPTSASDDITIGSLWGTACVPFTGGLMLQDLRHNAFKNCVCCFLVCGHFSYLQANAISKTSSCQGATCFDPLHLGLGQLICDILFLIGADCKNLFVWNFLKELLKYLLWGNVEIPLGSFPRPSLLWLPNHQSWSQNISTIVVNGCILLIVEVFSYYVQGVIVCWNDQGTKKSHLRLESQINLCRLFA